MRFLILSSLVSGLVIARAPLLRAQDAADQPKIDLPTESPSTPSSPGLSETPNSVLPDLSQLDEGFKQSSLGKAADESRTRLEWRKLANMTANEPDVVAAKHAADIAPTDLEKRRRLRTYYDLYYDKMGARASTPETKKALEEFKNEHLAMLTQPRVRPDEAAGLPTPTPTPKGKGKGKDKKKEKGNKVSKFRPGQ
jgi:hypothetical protein